MNTKLLRDVPYNQRRLVTAHAHGHAVRITPLSCEEVILTNNPQLHSERKGMCAMKKMVMVCAMAAVLAGCGKDNPVAPVVDEFRTIQVSPEVIVKVHNSIVDTMNFDVGIVDSTVQRSPGVLSVTASWIDGTRTAYGWNADRDFYIDFRTPRSCCYRVSYTYALHYALHAAGKPLIVYVRGYNADGSVNWRIIIGASVIRWMSPASDWFLFWQAKMQYVG